MRLGEKVQQLSQRLAFALAEAVACRPLSFHLEHGVTGHLTGLFNKQGGDSPTQKNILFMSFMSWFFMRRPVVDLGSETQDPRRAVSLAEPSAEKTWQSYGRSRLCLCRRPASAAQQGSPDFIRKAMGFSHDLLQQPQAPLLSPGQLRIFGKFELLLLVCTS
jgi:hypothetical protein